MFYWFVLFEWSEQTTGGGRAACGDAVHVAVLLQGHPTAQVQRAAQPCGDLREDCAGPL